MVEPHSVGAGSGVRPPRAQSQVMMAPKRTAEEIEARVQNNKALAADTHMKKTGASNQNF